MKVIFASPRYCIGDNSGVGIGRPVAHAALYAELGFAMIQSADPARRVSSRDTKPAVPDNATAGVFFQLVVFRRQPGG